VVAQSMYCTALHALSHVDVYSESFLLDADETPMLHTPAAQVNGCGPDGLPAQRDVKAEEDGEVTESQSEGCCQWEEE
jgi:hypothetical protein